MSKKSNLGKNNILTIIFVSLFSLSLILEASELKSEEVHGLALRGEPKYKAGFKHFDYVSPKAKKGGEIKLAALGAYDNFNHLSLEGNLAPGIGLIYDTLTFSSLDEPFSHYGSLAKSMNFAKDKLSITFKLEPDAKWHDGVKITADDVVFSYKTVLDEEKGSPKIRYYLADIKDIIAIDAETVKFEFKKISPELHLILGNSVSIIPKHYYKDRDLYDVSFDVPLGSGPYKVEATDKNRLTYTRVKNYWGKDKPVHRYTNNFDKIVYEIFQDQTIIRETVKAGKLDYFIEFVSKEWATGYDLDIFKSGKMIKKAFKTSAPHGMQAFIYNLEADVFKDPTLREALAYAFDFEWINKTLFYSAYKRIESFYGPEEMSSYKLPDKAELALVDPISDKVPKRIFKEVYKAPKTDGTQESFRKNLLKAKEMLTKKGYVLKQGKLISPYTKKPVAFELLLTNAAFERVVLPFKQNLLRLGVELTIKKVDITQYTKLVNNFEYEMIINSWGQSFSPGNEQYSFFGSEAAKTKNSYNYSRIQDDAVDYIIDKLVKADSLDDLNAAVRLLDRVLLFNFIVIPNWTIDSQRLIYSSKFSMPEVNTLYGQAFSTWWIE